MIVLLLFLQKQNLDFTPSIPLTVGVLRVRRACEE
jgi:hypothetical protein